jgi:hypothetical protein
MAVVGSSPRDHMWENLCVVEIQVLAVAIVNVSTLIITSE